MRWSVCVLVAPVAAACPPPSRAPERPSETPVPLVAEHDDQHVETVRLPDPNRYSVWGIDVSHHQHRIDWQRVAQQPKLKFAFMKATQGTTFVDSEFLRNWAGAREAGLRVGAYHYFSFCTKGSRQARHFLSVLPRDRDALPAVLDVEYLMNCRPHSDPDKVRAELRDWLRIVERATGKKPMVYATSDVLAEYFLGSDLDYPLWVRCTPEDPEPVLDLPWRFLQYDDQHQIPGIEGPVDHDVFAEDAEALVELSGRKASPARSLK